MLAWQGCSPSPDGSCAVGARACPSPALELASTWTFYSFCAFQLALNLVLLLLEFSLSWCSILPDPPECSPCSQRMIRVVLASCQSLKCIFSVCSFALRELLAKSVTSPVWSCRKSEFFPLSRCLAFASQVVGAAVGKGMCSFPRSGEMLLFYSDESCREQSRYHFCLALASPLRCFQPRGDLLKMWKGCARQAAKQTLKSGQEKQFVKACLFPI